MLTQARLAMIMLALISSTASYYLGRSGLDVGRAIVQSRCTAGAFMAHATAVSSVNADVHSDEAVTLPNVTRATTPVALSPVPLTGPNLIKNGNLETLNGILPDGWSSNAVGGNTSTFSRVTGDASAVALRIDTTNYVSGTADWFGPEITVTPGAYYQFSDVYRSSGPSRAVLMLKDSTGKAQYSNLDTTPASAQWATYTQRFFVPANVSVIMVSHPLDHNGWLETDNYSLVSATARAYDTGMVSLTFDDGWRTIHDAALPLMEKYQIVSTQYLVSGFLGQMNQYMTPGQVYDFLRAGHEIGSHTYDHPDLTQLSSKDLTSQLTLSSQALSKCFEPTTDFAPPFGASDQATVTAEAKLYQTARSTEVGFNSKDTLNPYQLKVQNVRSDTSPAQLKAWLDTAKSNRVWLILVYHQVDSGGGEYSRTPAQFETDLQSVVASGLPALTMHQAYQATQKQGAVQ